MNSDNNRIRGFSMNGRMRISCIFTVALIAFATAAHGQGDSTKVRPPLKKSQNNYSKRLKWIWAVNAAGIAGTYAYFIKPWWSGEKSDFEFKFDWYNNHWREIDKLGHFFANIQVAKFSATTFRYAGIERRKSLWIGFANSLVLYTAFELTDANFESWGFSIPDYIANILGASYPLLQDYYPFLNRFNFKISYRPSVYFKDGERARKPGFIDYKPYEYMLGDYDGQRFWLSISLHDWLPEQARVIWPSWLNIALGYGARNLPQRNAALKRRDFYVALDYHFHIHADEKPLVHALKSLLNAIHLPAPTVRFTESGAVLYGLHF